MTRSSGEFKSHHVYFAVNLLLWAITYFREEREFSSFFQMNGAVREHQSAAWPCCPPTHIEDSLFRLSCCFCHSLLGFFCRCYNSLLCLVKSFHEHIHGWRISSHKTRKKKNTLLIMLLSLFVCFFPFGQKRKKISLKLIEHQSIFKIHYLYPHII